MQIAICTTTIHNPVLLRKFRDMRDDVLFVVAGDLKSPHTEIAALATELGNTMYLHPEQQNRLGYCCHGALPWNCIQRRNIAILEAVRQGADLIYVWDDDNIPIDIDQFDPLTRLLGAPWKCDVFRSSDGWINVGASGRDSYVSRGFPYTKRSSQSMISTQRMTVKIGIASSLILGDPDINATERIERAPVVRSYRVPDHYVLNPRDTWAPINSQSTAYRRALAPLMLLPPGLGRYDDIWGSYIAQRVLMETNWHISIGYPFVRQERNDHDLIRDLEQELFGMRYTEQFCDDLRAVSLSPQASILDNLATVVDGLSELDYMPAQAVSFARAWVDDMERLL